MTTSSTPVNLGPSHGIQLGGLDDSVLDEASSGLHCCNVSLTPEITTPFIGGELMQAIVVAPEMAEMPVLRSAHTLNLDGSACHAGHDVTAATLSMVNGDPGAAIIESNTTTNNWSSLLEQYGHPYASTALQYSDPTFLAPIGDSGNSAYSQLEKSMPAVQDYPGTAGMAAAAPIIGQDSSAQRATYDMAPAGWGDADDSMSLPVPLSLQHDFLHPSGRNQDWAMTLLWGFELGLCASELVNGPRAPRAGNKTRHLMSFLFPPTSGRPGVSCPDRSADMECGENAAAADEICGTPGPPSRQVDDGGYCFISNERLCPSNEGLYLNNEGLYPSNEGLYLNNEGHLNNEGLGPSNSLIGGQPLPDFSATTCERVPDGEPEGQLGPKEATRKTPTPAEESPSPEDCGINQAPCQAMWQESALSLPEAVVDSSREGQQRDLAHSNQTPPRSNIGAKDDLVGGDNESSGSEIIGLGNSDDPGIKAGPDFGTTSISPQLRRGCPQDQVSENDSKVAHIRPQCSDDSAHAVGRESDLEFIDLADNVDDEMTCDNNGQRQLRNPGRGSIQETSIVQEDSAVHHTEPHHDGQVEILPSLPGLAMNGQSKKRKRGDRPNLTPRKKGTDTKLSVRQVAWTHRGGKLVYT